MVVVVAIPPERPAPPGYVEVGVGDAIRVANVAILSVPPYPTAPSGPYRPIVTSHDWPLTTERETAGNFRRTGALAFPTEVAERLYSALGLRTRTFEDDNLAEAAAVGIGSPALAYVGARLLEGPRNQKRPAVDDLLWLAGEWARVVPPGQVDGPQFTAYVARHLFTGPPPGTRRLMERIAAFDAEWVAQEAAVRSEAAGIPDDLVKHLF